MASPVNAKLRALPAVEKLLGEPALAGALAALPRPLVVAAVREELAAARARLKRDREAPPEPAAGPPPPAAPGAPPARGSAS